MLSPKIIFSYLNRFRILLILYKLIQYNLRSRSGRHDVALAIRTVFHITSCCRDVPEPDPRSPSPWRCSHPAKECGVLQGPLFQEPNQGLRPCTPLRGQLCYVTDEAPLVQRAPRTAFPLTQLQSQAVFLHRAKS
jgi:hypothetical protein